MYAYIFIYVYHTHLCVCVCVHEYSCSLYHWELVPEPFIDSKICGCLSTLYKMA